MRSNQRFDIPQPPRYDRWMKKSFLILLISGFCLSISPSVFSETEAPELDKNFTRTESDALEDVEKLHLKAEKFISENNYRAAIVVYEDIILIEPDDEVAYTNMGHAYLLLGDMPRARECFYNALHINPDNEASALGLQKIKDPDSLTS
jgi:tetratricopeptide (TPR) repeat protein